MKSLLLKTSRPGRSLSRNRPECADISENTLEASVVSSLYLTTPLADDDVLCVLNNDKRKAVEYDNCSAADGQERSVRCYYDDGSVCMEQQYKNGKLEGESRIYYASGKPQVLAMFSDDKAHGFARTYYENGQLQSELNYCAGKLDGDCRHYDAKGVLLRRESYKNGRRCD